MWVFDKRENFVSYYPEKIADEDGKPLINADQIPVDNAEMYLFKLMFSDKLMSDIIKESDTYFRNRLKRQYGENYSSKEFTSNSLPAIYLKTGGLEVADLQAYIACLLFMGILHLPRLDNYWSSEQIYKNFIPKVMSKNYFKMISAVLHLPISGDGNFMDEEDEDEDDKDEIMSKMMLDEESSKLTLTEDESKMVNFDDGKQDEKISNKKKSKSTNSNLKESNSNVNTNMISNEEQSQMSQMDENKKKKKKAKKDLNFEDPRIKVKHYLEEIVANAQKIFTCGRDVTIDESMIHFEGRSSLIFYMPAKPTKWGFKLHCLVDSKSHYFYDFIFDPGQNYRNLIMEDEEISFTENIVLSLLKKLENKGHRVFFDSWYSSVSLVEKLTEKGFQVISTLRNTSKNLPPKSEFNKNSKNFAYCNEKRALIQKYSDKKDVYFISNYDMPLDDMRNTYNFQNRGVDKMNENMSFYNIERRTIKWWKKIFFFGIELSITNAKILHDKFFHSYSGYDQLAFRKNLIMQLVQGYARPDAGGEAKHHVPGSIPLKYLNMLHDLTFVAGKGRCCVYCYQKGRFDTNTSYKCTQCGKALHPQCFLYWHKKNVYSI